MIVQYITVDHDKWDIIVCYGTSKEDFWDLYDLLTDYECPKRLIINGLNTITRRLNTGMTYTNDKYKTSIVCISDVTSSDQFVNTTIHEAKHVQSHICKYYNVDESGERAAYLIGYIVQKMYRALKLIEKGYYGRFQ